MPQLGPVFTADLFRGALGCGEVGRAVLEVGAGAVECAFGGGDAPVGDALAVSRVYVGTKGATAKEAHRFDIDCHATASQAVLTAPKPERRAIRMVPGTQMRSRMFEKRPVPLSAKTSRTDGL
jgi:hypothetical protein